MPDITLIVERVGNDGDSYFLVQKPDGNTPQVKKNFKVTWEPLNGGTYSSGAFCLLGVGRYDGGDFLLANIEVDAASGTVSAKAKDVSTKTPMNYVLLVLDVPSDTEKTPLVYMAYGGIPVSPLAGGERPQPPPVIDIDP